MKWIQVYVNFVNIFLADDCKMLYDALIPFQIKF